MSSNDHPCHDPFCELGASLALLLFLPETLLNSKSVSLSRSQYLWRSKSDLSLHATRYPYDDDDYYDQQTDLSPLEPPEVYHARARYSWINRHPTIRTGFESTASLVQPRDAPVPPVSVAQPSQPELPKGSKLFILVTCTCVAVFLQALVSIGFSCSKPCQTLLQRRVSANMSPGYNNHLHGYPPYNGTVSLPTAGRLVWFRLLPHHLLLPIALGSLLHFL